MNKAAIFDFNGTMYFDDDKQELSWYKFAKEVFNRNITLEEFNLHFHGFSNNEILTYLANRDFSKKEVLEYATKKELIYQKLCEDDKENLKLVDGIEEFLIKLKENNIKIAICTSSMKPNVDWYFKTFNLFRFFDEKDCIYDDGNLKKGKPDPEIYYNAFNHVNLPSKQIVVFEDSLSGLQSAKNADVGLLVKVGNKQINATYDVQIDDFKNINNKIMQFFNIK